MDLGAFRMEFITGSSLHSDEEVVDLLDAAPVWADEGVLTELGVRIGENYAWYLTQGKRAHWLEASWPELSGLFDDLRSDSEMAQVWSCDCAGAGSLDLGVA